jgi:hypothetical protein
MDEKTPIIQPATIAVLDDLESVEWFRNVGRARSERARSVSSWNEARRYLHSGASENVRIEASNKRRARVLEKSPAAYDEWNERLHMIKPIVTALVLEKALPFAKRHGWPDRALDVVRYDILGLAIDADYSDLVGPSIYSELGHWYRAGHFPLGWEGSTRDGALVVY